MLTLLALILLGVFFFGGIGRIAVGFLILLPVIIIGLLLLKLAIVALPVILVIALVVWIMKSASRGTV